MKLFLFNGSKLREVLTLLGVIMLTLVIFWSTGQDNISWAAPGQNPNLQTVPPPDDPPPPPPPPSAPPQSPASNPSPSDENEDNSNNEPEQSTPRQLTDEDSNTPSIQLPEDNNQETQEEAIPEEEKSLTEDNPVQIQNQAAESPASGEAGNGNAPFTPQQADLSLGKRVDNPAPLVGQLITYTLVLSNAGPDAATNIFVREALPGELNFVAATPTLGSYSAATGRWQVDTLASGETITLTIVVQVAQPGETLNTAEVIAVFQYDPDSAPDNNAESEDDQESVAVTALSDDTTSSVVSPSSDSDTTISTTNPAPGQQPFSDWSGLLLWLSALITGIILVFLGIFLVHRA